MGVAAWMFAFVGGLVAIFSLIILIADHAEQNSSADAMLVSCIIALVAGLCLVFGYSLGDGKAEEHPDSGVYQAASDCLVNLEPDTFDCAVWVNGTGRPNLVHVRTFFAEPIKYGNWFRMEAVDNGLYNVYRVDPASLEKCGAKSCPVR